MSESLPSSSIAAGSQCENDGMFVDGKVSNAPAVTQRTWSDMVASSNRDRRRVLDDKFLDDKFLDGNISMTFSDGEDGDLVFTVNNEVLQALATIWESSLIIKSLGNMVPMLSWKES